MKPKRPQFFILIIFFLIITCKLKAQVNTGDSLALVDLYNSTNGGGWKYRNNWLIGNVSSWYGVTVTGSRVTGLDLDNNHLNGSISTTIGNLSGLDTLRLEYNELTGNIPTSIGNLINLQMLNCSSNQLTGSIPSSILSLKELTFLHLSDNRLTDTLPAGLGSLNKLTMLILHNNQLTGSIPASIAKITTLNMIDISYNKLSGSLPTNIGNIKSMTKLILNDNKLTGILPKSIVNLSSLETLQLSDNLLSGSIPSSIGNLSNLTDLFLDYNQFTGKIPTSIGKLKKVNSITLRYNRLSGTIPSALNTLKNVYYIYFNNNALTGDVSTSLGKLKTLQILDISNNQLYHDKNTQPFAATKNMIVYMYNNNFTFNGLEYVATKAPQAAYTPQARLQLQKDSSGLSVDAGGTLSNNTYRWFKLGTVGNTTIIGNNVFKPSQSGQYYAQITNAIATKLTLTTDTISYTIGSRIQRADLNISLSPNPAKSTIIIRGIEGETNAKVTITDMTGFVYFTTMSRNQNSIHCDVSKLKSGSYTVSVNNGKQSKAVQFIKE